MTNSTLTTTSSAGGPGAPATLGTTVSAGDVPVEYHDVDDTTMTGTTYEVDDPREDTPLSDDLESLALGVRETKGFLTILSRVRLPSGTPYETIPADLLRNAKWIMSFVASIAALERPVSSGLFAGTLCQLLRKSEYCPPTLEGCLSAVTRMSAWIGLSTDSSEGSLATKAAEPPNGYTEISNRSIVAAYAMQKELLDALEHRARRAVLLLRPPEPPVDPPENLDQSLDPSPDGFRLRHPPPNLDLPHARPLTSSHSPSPSGSLPLDQSQRPSPSADSPGRTGSTGSSDLSILPPPSSSATTRWMNQRAKRNYAMKRSPARRGTAGGRGRTRTRRSYVARRSWKRRPAATTYRRRRPTYRRRY